MCYSLFLLRRILYDCTRKKALLKDAKLAFVDEKNYYSNSLIGPFLLIKDFASDLTLSPNSISFEGLNTDLKLLDRVSENIIRSLYFSDYTVNDMSEILSMEESEILKIKENAIKILHEKAINFSYLKLARKIFNDSDSYDDETLIAYYRIVYSIVDEFDLNEFSVSIENIKKDIQTLTPNQQKVLELYFFKNITVSQIAKEMSLSNTRINDILGRALINLSSRAKEFSFKTTNEEAIFRLMQEIKEKVLFKDDFHIYNLHIHDSLKTFFIENNIRFLSQIRDLDLSEFRYIKISLLKDLYHLKNYVKTNYDFIIKKLSLEELLNSGIVFENELSLFALNLDTRLYNGLSRNYISTVSKFLTLFESDVIKFRTLGEMSINELTKVQKKIWYSKF